MAGPKTPMRNIHPTLAQPPVYPRIFYSSREIIQTFFFLLNHFKKIKSSDKFFKWEISRGLVSYKIHNHEYHEVIYLHVPKLITCARVYQVHYRQHHPDGLFPSRTWSSGFCLRIYMYMNKKIYKGQCEGNGCYWCKLREKKKVLLPFEREINV